MGLMLLSIILLVNPYTWRDETMLTIVCICVFVGTWIDKGLGMISGGFVPNPCIMSTNMCRPVSGL